MGKRWLYIIPRLKLEKRLPDMNDVQLDEYIHLLNLYVEAFPKLEAEMRAILEKCDFSSLKSYFSKIKDILAKIHAEEMAKDCVRYIETFDIKNSEKITANADLLLSSMAELAIDIQVALFKKEKDKNIALSAKAVNEQNAVKTILAVDDDTFCLDVFKAALKGMSCKIIAVTSAKSALEVLLKQKPDLFVLDIDMPEMNGIELAEEIRKGNYKEPIIFITGNASKEYVEKALKAGASEFILKPINPQSAIDRIGKFL
jgi:CheY-like chemotaxis protein